LVAVTRDVRTPRPLIGLRTRITVALNWLWEYLMFQRRARLIL
jgi:hypothetical protein